MPLLGIDLGTTFSAVAYLDSNGTPTTIPSSEGDLTTPSVVLVASNGEIIVGREARRAALAEPNNVAEGVKRYMGDPDFPKLVNGRRFTPVELSALILLKLIQDAQKRVGPIHGVVITVPAYFDEARRQATASAGALAGINVIDIINEPTSAALAYAYRSFSNDSNPTVTSPAAVTERLPGTVLVYDLGGGTFDVTILRIDGGNLKVLATAGDVRLGGRDWDERLFNYMADEFIRVHGEDPREDPVSTQNLMLTAEETKKILSARRQAHYIVNHAGKSHSAEITRETFDELTQDLLYRSENRLGRVIEQADLSWDQIGQVLSVGGSTRMPQVADMLRRVTGKEPNCSLSPDEAIAHGAAIHAAISAAQPAARPADSKEPPPHPSAAQRELQAQVAGNFKKRVVDLLRAIRTTNVNAHSLGVVVMGETKRKSVSVLVPHNTPLPCGVTKRFRTVCDNQTTVTVRVVEGESNEPEDCLPVGACSIRNLPPGLPKGSPVEVTFTYDNSGRLHVGAVEITTGKWASVSIERNAASHKTNA